MADSHELLPLGPAPGQLAAVLQNCNALSARYGLVLNRTEMQMLARRQADALRDTGRIEFGPGPYEKLIYTFCDSPYLLQTGYAELLAELCELFYAFKSESGERWSDDELIEAMAQQFNGECRGSVELVADRLWQQLHDGPAPEQSSAKEEDFEQ